MNATTAQTGIWAIYGCFFSRTDAWFVIKVESVEWETYPGNDAIDTCPKNGGKRIFPDKKTPTDVGDRKKVRVKAKILPVVAGQTVYFRAFDVDDPSSSSSPVDGNDASGPTGGDNRRAAGGLSATSATTDSSGYARVDFTVSMQPGDNFRAFAACSDPVLSALTQSQVDSGSIPSSIAQSEMLTSWRTLHVEMDSMVAPTGNQITDAVKDLVFPDKVILASSAIDDGSLNMDDSPVSGAGRFENGTLVIGTGGSAITISSLSNNGDNYLRKVLPVINGTVTKGGTTVNVTDVDLDQSSSYDYSVRSLGVTIDTSFNGGTLTVAGHSMTIQTVIGWGSGGSLLKIDGSPNLPCAITDDDATSAPAAISVNAIVNSRFADAYVRCVVDGAGNTSYNNNDVPFIANLSETGNAVDAMLGSSTKILQSSSGRSDSYWGSYVLVAFQTYAVPYDVSGNPASPDYRADGDPDSEEGGDGSSPTKSATMSGVYSGSKKGIICFEEDGRECGRCYSWGLSDLLEGVTAHEIGHAFGGSHGDGGLMGPLSCPVAAFAAPTLQKIRDKVSSP